MTCDCAGRQHVVCRPKWIKVKVGGPSLPRYNPREDATAFVLREVRKIGPTPETFRYAAPIASDLDCQCKGKRHPVCLPEAKWKAWALAVHRFLDRTKAPTWDAVGVSTDAAA